MKTIEERARVYANKHERFQLAMFKAYIDGATEQQKLDNEQLCEMILDNQNAIIDKACEWMEKAIEQWNDAERHRTFFIDKDGAIRNFRKAMKQ